MAESHHLTSQQAIYNEVQFDGNSTATDKAGHDLDTQAASTSATVNVSDKYLIMKTL